MQLANCWVLLDKRNSNVPLRGVTPAELMILIRDRGAFVGRFPVHNLVILPRESSRTNDVEKERLRAKYGNGLHDKNGKRGDMKIAKVDQLYPGEGSVLPQKFEDLGDNFTKAKENFLEKPTSDVPDWDASVLSALDREAAMIAGEADTADTTLNQTTGTSENE